MLSKQSWARDGLVRLVCSLSVAIFLLAAQAARAQETSRQIPFNYVVTSLPPGTTQDVTVELRDMLTGGLLLFSEAQPGLAVTDDGSGNGVISFVFGSLTLTGLDPAQFPSGSSRWLDVVQSGASVLVGGRMALNATAFALSPGPAGPQGDPGPRGDPGPPGPPVSITSPGGTIAVGGTVTDRTLDVAANAIANVHVANGALAPAKITGTAATLGPNTFTGNQNVTGSVSATGGGVSGSGVVGVSGFSAAANGTGVAGEANAATASGVVGLSTSGRGVVGSSTSGTGVSGSGGNGVFGSSPVLDGNGVVGDANNGTNAYGVWGRSTSGYGVVGGSTSGDGVRGSSVSRTGVWGGSTSGVGTSGNSTSGTGVVGASTSGTGGYFITNSATQWALQALGTSPTGQGVFVRGRLAVQGRKSGAVETESGKAVLLYALETPEPVFEDLGSATLENGVAVIPIEPTFAKTVNTSAENYLIFLTPEGPNASLYVAGKTATSFEVRSLDGPDISFNWRIVAKQKGNENIRLETIDLPGPETTKAQTSPAPDLRNEKIRQP